MQVSICDVPGEGLFLFLQGASMREMRSKVVEVGRELPNHRWKLLCFDP